MPEGIIKEIDLSSGMSKILDIRGNESVGKNNESVEIRLTGDRINLMDVAKDQKSRILVQSANGSTFEPFEYLKEGVVPPGTNLVYVGNPQEPEEGFTIIRRDKKVEIRDGMWAYDENDKLAEYANIHV